MPPNGQQARFLVAPFRFTACVARCFPGRNARIPIEQRTSTGSISQGTCQFCRTNWRLPLSCRFATGMARRLSQMSREAAISLGLHRRGHSHERLAAATAAFIFPSPVFATFRASCFQYSLLNSSSDNATLRPLPPIMCKISDSGAMPSPG